MRYMILLLALLTACVPLDIVPTEPPEPDFNNSAEHIIASKAICHWVVTPDGWLPDPECSPGDIFKNCGKAEICTPGYTATVRNVSLNTKDLVYNNYGVLLRTKGEWEMDHIVPLTLCGSNDIKNLYPQPAEPRLGYKEKDWLETHARDWVCDENMSLQEAQERIARDWIAFYKERKNG
jgi:hypothetical protein